jgi:sugar O-acyltransferase (sialic acid O-acetyltransferase NeuD family)
MSEKYLIFGASGFGREVLCCLMDSLKQKGINPMDKIAFAETTEFCSMHTDVLGYPVFNENELDSTAYLALVAISDPHIRAKIVNRLPKNQAYHTLIHPSAVISDWVTIGEGSIITAGVVLTTQIELGKHAQLNLQTTIGHDCSIGDYFTTAPGAKINGNNTIGHHVYMGTNAITKQGIQIVSDVTVGMGTVVLKDIQDAGVYIGCPAQKIK